MAMVANRQTFHPDSCKQMFDFIVFVPGLAVSSVTKPCWRVCLHGFERCSKPTIAATAVDPLVEGENISKFIFQMFQG